MQKAEDMSQTNQEAVADLSPQGFFSFFAEVSDIPRGSGNTAQMAAYLEDFAGRRGLECERDAAGNIVIRKPARHTVSKAGVILQAHQDMVCVGEPGIGHDFTRDPVRLVRDGEWLRAAGTTLGADNGAGMAAILAVLADPDLVHPTLEGLFTVDEETSMKGAKAVRADQLRGNILINIDSEEYGIAYVSCAASAAYTLSIPVKRRPSAISECRRLVVGGLRGGHSGVEIHRERANAFVLAARVLSAAAAGGIDFGLCSLDNGIVPGAGNGIPARAEALLAFPAAASVGEMGNLAAACEALFRKEFRASDPGVSVTLEPAAGPAPAPLLPESRDRLLAALRLMPLGVIRFGQDENLLAKPYGEVWWKRRTIWALSKSRKKRRCCCPWQEARWRPPWPTSTAGSKPLPPRSAPRSTTTCTPTAGKWRCRPAASSSCFRRRDGS